MVLHTDFINQWDISEEGVWFPKTPLCCAQVLVYSMIITQNSFKQLTHYTVRYSIFCRKISTTNIIQGVTNMIPILKMVNQMTDI